MKRPAISNKKKIIVPFVRFHVPFVLHSLPFEVYFYTICIPERRLKSCFLFRTYNVILPYFVM